MTITFKNIKILAIAMHNFRHFIFFRKKRCKERYLNSLVVADIRTLEFGRPCTFKMNSLGDYGSIYPSSKDYGHSNLYSNIT